MVILISDFSQLYQNLNRLLKPNGDLFVSFVYDNGAYPVYESLAQSPKWSKYMPNINSYISRFHLIRNLESIFPKFLENHGFKTRFTAMERIYANFDQESFNSKFYKSRNGIILPKIFWKMAPKPNNTNNRNVYKKNIDLCETRARDHLFHDQML